MPEIKELLGKESLLAVKDYVDTVDSTKADKVGPLPHFNILNTNTNVLDFITANNIAGRTIVLHIEGNQDDVIGIFIPVGSKYAFRLTWVSSTFIFESDVPVDLTNITWNDIFDFNSSPFKKEFEMTSNKVSSLSVSSTNTQYPSAKAVYDNLLLKAEKVGQLPNFGDIGSQLVTDIVETYSLSGKPFVFEASNRKFIGIVDYPGSGITIGTFDFRQFGGSDDIRRFHSRSIDFANKQFSNLLSATYAQFYELMDNKVISIDSSSTNNDYPSAKCVYDKLDLKSDKTGPLPYYFDLENAKVMSFVNDNDLRGRAIILSFAGVPNLIKFTSSGPQIINCSISEIGSLQVKNVTVTDPDTPFYSILSGSEGLETGEVVSNKVTSLDNSSTDNEYPSAKCVYDQLETKLPIVSVSSETLLKDLPWLGILSTSDVSTDKSYFRKIPGFNNRIELIVEKSNGYYYMAGKINNLTLAEYFQQANFHEYVIGERTIAGIDLADDITTSELTNALFTVTDIVLNA